MPTRTPLTLLLDGVLFEDAERVEMALSRIRRLVNLATLRESPLRSITALEQIVQALMTHHPQLAKVPTSLDSSLPLHYAARMDSMKIVHRLIQRYRGGVLVQNVHGKTPLHFAARDGKLDIVRQILQIAPETASISSGKGKLPLHYACREGHVEICRALLRVHPQGASWQTDKCKVPLHYCARWGHLEIAKELVNVYKEGVSILDYEGSLPLHEAIRQGQTEMVRFLVPPFQKGLQVENVRGETPLFTAVRSGNYELSAFLINAWPEGGKKVLQSARFDDQLDSWEPDLLNMCLYGAAAFPDNNESGGVGGEIMVRAKSSSDQGDDNKTATSQSVAKEQGSTNKRRLASISGEIVQKRRHLEDDSNDQQEPQQLAANATTKQVSSFFLPLHAALECGASPAVLNHILQKGTTSQLMERNALGMLPLHLAAMHYADCDHIPTIIDIIWKRYEQASSVRDNLGRLPLHLALEARADCQLVECLLQSSARMHAGRPQPSTKTSLSHLDEYPLLMATEYGCDLSTVFLLLREDPSILKNAATSPK